MPQKSYLSGYLLHKTAVININLPPQQQQKTPLNLFEVDNQQISDWVPLAISGQRQDIINWMLLSFVSYSHGVELRYFTR